MGITIFTPAPLPRNESQRSEAAVNSGLLNRADDARLEQIVEDTRRVLNASWCGITVMIDDKQHVTVSTGGRIGMHSRSTSLCSYAITDEADSFHVLDAATDERFAGNPFVEDGVIRFFAGAPIYDADKFAVGVLCISDNTPRERFDDVEVRMLQRFAGLISGTK